MESGAYGASLAGGDFDFMSFVKQPQTIVRILSWIFSIVVFATITGEGYVNPSLLPDTKCMFNRNDSACGFGVGVWTLFWFICFCVLANQWSHTTEVAGIPVDAARAVVAFSFFSIVTWALLTTFAYTRYRQGVSDLDQGYTDPAKDYSTPYPSTSAYPPYPTSGPEGYQQSPFTPQNQEDPAPYQHPSY
ncbi:synaptogyrin-2 isoform X2 [Oncorhynchus kisutch]|uniref:synaptogyrin-2 isoform X2 n=1 Tax=Oncorhynchus kisutch TaxID=8019 RepID=UPI0012DEA642|nr:synaptogyrin-2-like isoform X2 [Oncorhynchus kisutch]